MRAAVLAAADPGLAGGAASVGLAESNKAAAEAVRKERKTRMKQIMKGKGGKNNGNPRWTNRASQVAARHVLARKPLRNLPSEATDKIRRLTPPPR
ncbi:hypothetical protein GCM10023172_21180 [Hymenobacter ginsengisoli]|uniref:Uncharacterized protein n=1 Tax=Hymenobacter ginsengisoli TaxID=1051626 RepID=A0ABP8QEV4_9BACT